jgi:STAM-binding protein
MPSTANALILHLNAVYLDFVSGLRTVNIPMELMRKFIDVASPNTRLNRETCGILAGRLVRLNYN